MKSWVTIQSNTHQHKFGHRWIYGWINSNWPFSLKLQMEKVTKPDRVIYSNRVHSTDIIREWIREILPFRCGLVDKTVPIAASLPHEPPPTPSCSKLRCLVEKRRRTSPVLARPSPWTKDHQRSRSPTHSFIPTAPPLPAHPRLSPPPKVSKVLRLVVPVP
jgi:hypothetical protein